jgi:hypothetical protein
VRVLDASTLLFPSYDGNGMYLSMGNISGNPEIGMLFIDFEKPFRLRAQGRAELIFSGPELQEFKDVEAETPFCEWKRIDTLQDVVRPAERSQVEAIGTTTIDDWMGKVMSGDKGV